MLKKLDRNIKYLFLLTMGVFILSIVLQLINQNLPEYPLSYSRYHFFSQIYWQWITPNIVHVNWMHWLLNILNFMALMIFFYHAWTVKNIVLIYLSSSLFIMLCLYIFSENVSRYAGMSGVLYTFATYGSLVTFKEQKILSSFILLYCSIKLAANDWINNLMMVDKALDDVMVITDVHLYGAILGLVFGVLQLIKQKLY